MNTFFTLDSFSKMYGAQPATNAVTSFTPEWATEANAPTWDTAANAEVASQN